MKEVARAATNDEDNAPTLSSAMLLGLRQPQVLALTTC
jgi:hypothetical protein